MNKSSDSAFELTPRNRVKRLPERGHYDRETIYSIIDEALICHVAFVQDDQPFIIPTLHARDGDNLLLHGATTSRMLKHIADGYSISVCMTIVDGLVLAKSAFHHSVNYRSIVLFGSGSAIKSESERRRALELFTERMIPGRWAGVRVPNANEMRATTIVSIPIELASAKIRTGVPKDDEADSDLPIWSGVVPLVQIARDPISDAPYPVPAHVAEYVKRKS